MRQKKDKKGCHLPEIKLMKQGIIGIDDHCNKKRVNLAVLLGSD
jgi:hypothetical protein